MLHLVEQNEFDPSAIWRSFVANFKAVEVHCEGGSEPVVKPLTAVDPWLITGQAASSGKAFLRPFASQTTIECKTGQVAVSYPLNAGSAVVFAIGFLTFMYGGSIASSDFGYYGGGFTLGAVIGLALLLIFASRKWKEAGTLASITVLSNSITGLLRRMNANGSADAIDSWNRYNPMAWLTMEIDLEGWGLGDLGLPPIFGWQVFTVLFVLSSSLFVGFNIGKPTPGMRMFLRFAATVAGLLLMASALPDVVFSACLAALLALAWGCVAFWNLIRQPVMYWAIRLGCWCWPLPHRTATAGEALRACREATAVELERLRLELRKNMRHLAPLMVDPAVDDFARNQGFDVDPVQIAEARRESLDGSGDVRVDDEGRLIREDEIGSDGELERMLAEEDLADEDTDLRRRIGSARKQREFVSRLRGERERRLSGGESRVSGDDSRVSGGDSRVSGGDSRVSGGDSRVSGDDSRVSGGDSRVSGDDSRVSGGDSRVSLPQLSPTAADVAAHTPTGYHEIPREGDSDGEDVDLEWRGVSRRARSRSTGQR